MTAIWGLVSIDCHTANVLLGGMLSRIPRHTDEPWTNTAKACEPAM